MRALTDLIGEEIIATFDEEYGIEGDCRTDVRCKVLSVFINDFYFHDKGEPIYILLNLSPVGDMPKGFESDDFHQVSLDNITKAY